MRAATVFCADAKTETLSGNTIRGRFPESLSGTLSDNAFRKRIPETSRKHFPPTSRKRCPNTPRPPEFVPEKRIKHDALRLSLVGNKETIKAHCAHHLAAVDGTQAIEGMEAALTAWVAAQCDRPMGQELRADDELHFVKEVEAAKRRELDAWCKFQVFSPVLGTRVTKDVVETRRVPTWKDLDGKRAAKDRWVARGFQGPDLAEGLVDTSSCVSLRSSHLQVISLSAQKKWKLRNLDIENVFLQADPFPREFYPQAPSERRPRNPNRAWRLNAPAYGLNDAPVEFHKTLKRYLLKSEESLKMAGLRFETSTLDPCLYMVFNGERGRRRAFSPRTLMTSWYVGLRVSLTAPATPWCDALVLSRCRRITLSMWAWS